MHVLGLDAVVVLQHAAHEHEPGRAPLRGADPLALQVLRRLDAGAGAHVDAGVAEDFRERHRHRHERALAAALERRVGGERELRDLELLVVQHALERLARAQDPDVEIDAFGFHPPVDQRAGAVVVQQASVSLRFGIRMFQRQLATEARAFARRSMYLRRGSRQPNEAGAPFQVEQQAEGQCRNHGAVGTPAASSRSTIR